MISSFAFASALSRRCCGVRGAVDGVVGRGSLRCLSSSSPSPPPLTSRSNPFPAAPSPMLGGGSGDVIPSALVGARESGAAAAAAAATRLSSTFSSPSARFGVFGSSPSSSPFLTSSLSACRPPSSSSPPLLVLGGAGAVAPVTLAPPGSFVAGSVRGMKTNRAAAKRFRVKGNGKIKRARAGRQHNTGYLTRKRKNHLGHSTGIKGKKIEKRIRRLIGAL